MVFESVNKISNGRRSFLKQVSAATGLIVVSGTLAACGTAPTAIPPTATPVPQPPAGFDAVGEVSKFKPNADPVAFTVKDMSGFVYNKAGEYIVYSNVCTHQGCEVPYEAAVSKFVCPCHKSEYDKMGEVIKGPALKRLPRLEFKVVGNSLYAKLS